MGEGKKVTEEEEERKRKTGAGSSEMTRGFRRHKEGDTQRFRFS